MEVMLLERYVILSIFLVQLFKEIKPTRKSEKVNQGVE